MSAPCQVLDDIAMVRGRSRACTAAASMGENAALANARPVPRPAARRYRGRALVSPMPASSARASDMSTTIDMPAAVTLRRSMRSAICPAGSANTRAGMNSANPMSPKVSGLPVRW